MAVSTPPCFSVSVTSNTGPLVKRATPCHLLAAGFAVERPSCRHQVRSSPALSLRANSPFSTDRDERSEPFCVAIADNSVAWAPCPSTPATRRPRFFARPAHASRPIFAAGAPCSLKAAVRRLPTPPKYLCVNRAGSRTCRKVFETPPRPAARRPGDPRRFLQQRSPRPSMR